VKTNQLPKHIKSKREHRAEFYCGRENYFAARAMLTMIRGDNNINVLRLLATKRAVITWPRRAAVAGNRTETRFRMCKRCSAPAGGMLPDGQQLRCDEQQQHVEKRVR
jgi:hypothetical protein